MAFDAAVAVSRSWEAREAGREVALKASSHLRERPTYALLFSTIHYEHRGGFQELLDGVHEYLSPSVPLVGGTIPGFMTHEGCFGRGAVLALVRDDSSDVAVGVGKNVKRDPVAAAQQCADSIRGGLLDSKREKSIVFEFISGPTIPKFPFISQVRVLKNRLLSKIFSAGAGLFLRYFQKGVGREEEFLREFVRQLPGFTVLGGSTLDANNLVSNYQFINNQVITNSVVALGMKTERDFTTSSGFCQAETDIRFKVTEKAGENRIITKIDGRPAMEEFLRKAGWAAEDLNERLYRKTFHRTIGFKRGGVLFPEVIGAIYGDDIWVGYQVEGDELILLTTSGKKLVESVDETLARFAGRDVQLGFIVSCASRMETLGKETYVTQERISKFFGPKPFLLVWMGGEDISTPELPCHHANYGFNGLVFS